MVSLRAGEERCKCALHGAADGHAALGGDVNAYEGLYKARRLPFELGVALYIGVLRGYAAL